ncbi:hypothetical protein HF086_005120 [Spodoptera exigua]|uniref:Uncharacterized protein n=1 Tax=Spodoptera exigua TaxID=7107 RepID=A0A922SLL1_SPOEX|nr:hypothetical protein HF086_005120 [Spodoptera exigua]
MAPSTSTIFYDLDDIAKRHSFHCLTELNMSSAKLMKMARLSPSPIVLGESESIGQQCATQIHILPRDSKELSRKKVKKKLSPHSPVMDFRDDEKIHDFNKNYHNNNLYERHQKFWSFAKYRTEYTKPKQENYSARKKGKGRYAEAPCPCQLFSYTCPCTVNKSTSQLVNVNKSLINLVDQITSTSKIVEEEKISKARTLKRELVREDKPTNTSIAQMIEVDIPNENKGSTINVAYNNETPNSSDKSNDDKRFQNKTRSRKMTRKVLCPNCKEKVDVLISISTTEVSGLKHEHSSIYRCKEIPSTTAYACRVRSKIKNISNSDLCLHEPPCELVPVCQILPTDNNFYNDNHKCATKHSVPKSTPRIIRITKACRHHPPCTVVPSCQRANVLKNNCEYIPPCLHRPRCVNLPLCVPFSKSLHYEEATNKVGNDINGSDYPHTSKYKYIPVCEHDSITNTMNHQINIVSRVPNGCEFLNDYNSFLLNANSPCVTKTFSPCLTDHYTCISNKSCQFEPSHSKFSHEVQENRSNESVIFIRDVGCQFRNKGYSPKDSAVHSVHSKGLSKSFDFLDVKMGNYNTNIHTPRYEDKNTSPISGEDYSFTTISSSLDLESECPSHGRRHLVPNHQRTIGFVPKSAYVTAFASVPESQSSKYEGNNKLDAYPVKSRRSFLKGKYRKMFSVKRRRKSRTIPAVVQNGVSVLGKLVVVSWCWRSCVPGGSPGNGTTGPMGPNPRPGYVEIPSTVMDGLCFVVL